VWHEKVVHHIHQLTKMSPRRTYTGLTTPSVSLAVHAGQHRHHGHFLRLASPTTTAFSLFCTYQTAPLSLLSSRSLQALKYTVCERIHKDSLFVLELLEQLKDTPPSPPPSNLHGIAAATITGPSNRRSHRYFDHLKMLHPETEQNNEETPDVEMDGVSPHVLQAINELLIVLPLSPLLDFLPMKLQLSPKISKIWRSSHLD